MTDIKCPHLSSGCCTVCTALAAARAELENLRCRRGTLEAELQRVRGQRDRLAAAAQPILKRSNDALAIRAKLTGISAGGMAVEVGNLAVALADIAAHP
jgi:hypothetical protein